LHVITRKALKEAATKHSDIGPALDAWFQIARKAEWHSINDVRQTYPAADGVMIGKKAYTVFNVCGNKFRLIVKIEYEYQKIFIKHVLTHAKYSTEEWKR
jgi:mRNA interferase HigB